MFISSALTASRALLEVKMLKSHWNAAKVGYQVSITIIRCYLHTNWMFGRMPEKPFVSNHHKCKHIKLSENLTGISAISLFCQQLLKLGLALKKFVCILWKAPHGQCQVWLRIFDAVVLGTFITCIPTRYFKKNIEFLNKNIWGTPSKKNPQKIGHHGVSQQDVQLVIIREPSLYVF